MGWRSWNAFGNNINRTIIDNNLAALTAKIWKVHGSDAFMSLADMGYNDFGIGIVQASVCGLHELHRHASACGLHEPHWAPPVRRQCPPSCQIHQQVTATHAKKYRAGCCNKV